LIQALETDLYAALGLAPSCSRGEIKRAFREQAKRFHPDLTGGDSSKTETMRAILRAYEILSDVRKRREYDQRFRKALGRYVFDYRSFLKRSGDDPEAQAKLIFFDLLHGEEGEAVDVYRLVFRLESASLKPRLDREDYMDCAFLLAEALLEREMYQAAFGVLSDLAAMEREKPYFGHFFPEVTILLKRVVREKLPNALAPDAYIAVLEKMTALGFPRRENARYFKKIALAYAKKGEREKSALYLSKALECDRYLSGVNGLKKKIRYRG
jgi:tetratricopeptide (TPR) repeat protein